MENCSPIGNPTRRWKRATAQRGRQSLRRRRRASRRQVTRAKQAKAEKRVARLVAQEAPATPQRRMKGMSRAMLSRLEKARHQRGVRLSPKARSVALWKLKKTIIQMPAKAMRR